MATEPTARTTDEWDQPMSDAQRRALFAAATSRGMTLDDLRGMTPAGSVSMLTRGQASRLLDRLNAGGGYAHPRRPRRGRRRPKGVFAIATEAQRNKVEQLRIRLGWTDEQLQAWLAGRHFVDGRSMDSFLVAGAAVSTNDLIAVIELLKGVAERSEAARARRSAKSDEHRGL